MLGNQGLHLLGGEAYIQYKPEMIATDHTVTDAGIREFLKALIDRFAVFAGKLAAA